MYCPFAIAPHMVAKLPYDIERDFQPISMYGRLPNIIVVSAKLPISRWQRDLTDSTVLRALGTAFGHMLIGFDALQRGLHKLSVNPERLAADLDASWEVLAEAVQTVMRRDGLPNPYEQLKALTRGHGITADSMRAFVESLELPAADKQRLLEMTPGSYTGLAEQLAKEI